MKSYPQPASHTNFNLILSRNLTTADDLTFRFSNFQHFEWVSSINIFSLLSHLEANKHDFSLYTILMTQAHCVICLYFGYLIIMLIGMLNMGLDFCGVIVYTISNYLISRLLPLIN